MKTFILGIVFGAAAFAISDRLLRETQLSAANPPRAAVEQRSDDSTSGGVVETALESKTVPVSKHIVEITSSSSVRSFPEVGSQEGRNMERVCTDWYSYKSKQEVAARAAQPKDPQWSYAMEPLLQQYMTTHPQGSKFQTTSVDCRTTFCEVKGMGADEEAVQAFQQVMQDAAKESWSTFTPHGASGSSSDGTKFVFDYRLQRRSDAR